VLNSEVEQNYYRAGTRESVRIRVTARDGMGNPSLRRFRRRSATPRFSNLPSAKSASKNALFGDRFQTTGAVASLVPPGAMFPTDNLRQSAFLAQEVGVPASAFERSSSAIEKFAEERASLSALAERLAPLRFLIIAAVLFISGAVLVLRNILRSNETGDAHGISLGRGLGAALVFFIPLSLGWILIWNFIARGDNPLIEALALSLAPPGVVLIGAIALMISRKFPTTTLQQHAFRGGLAFRPLSDNCHVLSVERTAFVPERISSALGRGRRLFRNERAYGRVDKGG